MTYVVTESCIKCKYQDCVEVCPVDCFYTGENMLVIHPDECIDCGVCEPECPAEAIVPDTDSAGETGWSLIKNMLRNGQILLGKAKSRLMLIISRTKKVNSRNISALKQAKHKV